MFLYCVVSTVIELPTDTLSLAQFSNVRPASVPPSFQMSAWPQSHHGQGFKCPPGLSPTKEVVGSFGPTKDFPHWKVLGPTMELVGSMVPPMHATESAVRVSLVTPWRGRARLRTRSQLCSVRGCM